MTAAVQGQENERTALIGNIQKFSTEDGPGIRTTVFFKGCPLRCRWCHNPEMIRPQQELIQSPANCIGCGRCSQVCPKGAISAGEESVIIDRTLCDLCLICTKECYAEALRPVAKVMTVSQVVEEAAKDKGFYDNTGGGVTLSGGEVLMHADFAEQVTEALAEQGIEVCLDTCGYGAAEDLLRLARMENVTTILYDVKALDDLVHQAYTRVSNKRILENLRRLAEDPQLASKITVRLPLISGVNDDLEMIRKTAALCEELGLARIDLLPYHDLGVSKARNVGGSQESFEPPSEERMEEIRQIFGLA